MLHLIMVGSWLVGGTSLGPERNRKVCEICADVVTTENHFTGSLHKFITLLH